MAICWERAVPLAFHLYCFYFSAVLIVGVPSRLVFRAGCGIRLYRFLIIAFLSILLKRNCGTFCEFCFRTSTLLGLWKSGVPLPHFCSNGRVKTEIPPPQFHPSRPVKLLSSASAFPLYRACEDLKFRFRTSSLPGRDDLKFRFRTFALPGLWRSEVPVLHFLSTGPVKIWSSASALLLYLACEDLKFRFITSALSGLGRSEYHQPESFLCGFRARERISGNGLMVFWKTKTSFAE